MTFVYQRDPLSLDVKLHWCLIIPNLFSSIDFLWYHLMKGISPLRYSMLVLRLHQLYSVFVSVTNAEVK